MIAKSLNLLGMLVSEKIQPIFDEELARLRQEGLHEGDYLTGFIESGVKSENKTIIDYKALENMKFTTHDNFLSYDKALASRSGDEIMMGEQI